MILMGSRINPAILQVINVAAILATILFNSIVNVLPLNGVTTGRFQTLIQTFSLPQATFSQYGE